MVSNVELANLPYGQIYIIKSLSDIFLWEVNKIPNLDYLYSININDLTYLLAYPDVLTKNKFDYILIENSSTKFPANITISNKVRLFVWLSNVGTYSDSQLKFLDKYSNYPFQIVDLTTNTYNKDSYFIDLSNKVKKELNSIELINLPIILEEYKSNPIKLNYLLSNSDLIQTNHIVSTVNTINSILEDLATPNPSLIKLNTIKYLPKSTLTELLVRPKLRFTLLYKIIKGIYKDEQVESINCPSLWLWLEILFTRLNKGYYNYPEYILKLFLHWVYSCNKYYATPLAKGFYSYIKYKKIVYNFEPSENAIKYFYTLF